ncbi:MAG TPA: methyltransferase domain-containing protein [Methyloceanibacter sp.]|nr:methyltransferase domain-containing protein [Methyloceanibacter sp.]
MLLRRFFNRERKYLDDDLQLRRAQSQADALALERSPPLEILDIGLGSGHFLAICQKLGHRCVGLDQTGASNFIKEIRASLGVTNVIEHTIEPLKPFPPMGRFDLITCYRCRFYFIGKAKRLWNEQEWVFFLNDIRDHLLKPNGRFVLHAPPTKRAKWEAQFSPAIAKLLHDRGGRAAGNILMFAPLL